MNLSPATLALIQRIATKLNEKSSVYGYAMIFAGLFAAKYRNDFAIGAGIVSATAGIVLWFLSDAQVRALLTGQPAAAPQPPTVPPPQDHTQR